MKSLHNAESLSYRKLILFSLPSIAAVGLEPLAELIDTAILGQVNSKWVAAQAAVNAFLASFAWVFNFLSHGPTAQIGQKVGQGKTISSGIYIRAALLMALFLGVIFSLVLFGGRNFLLQYVLGAQPELVETATPYWNIRVLGYPLTLMAMALIGILRGLQQIKISMFAIFVMTLINALGSYLSVIHWDCGPEGAAWSTVLSFLVCDMILLFALVQRSAEIGLFRKTQESLQTMLHLGQDAFHLTVRTACLSSAFFILIVFATRLGSQVLASHQIMLQLWLLASFSMDGFAVTATALGAKLIGQKRFREHLVLCKRLATLGFGMGVIVSLCYAIGQKPILYFFSQDVILHTQLKSLWLLLVLTQPLNGVLYVLDGVLFGCKQFSYIRKVIVHGLGFVFLPLIVCGYYSGISLFYLWSCLFALNLYRLAFGCYRIFFKKGLVNINYLY